MNLPNCERESAVLKAAESGQWSKGLRAHAQACEVCSDALLVTHYLQSQAQAAQAEAPLPDAGLIWWKAQLQAKRAAAERATRPIVILEKISYAVGAVGIAVLLVWFWPQIANWAGMFKLVWAQSSSLGMPLLQPSAYLLAGGGTLLFVFFFFLYAVWAEE